MECSVNHEAISDTADELFKRYYVCDTTIASNARPKASGRAEGAKKIRILEKNVYFWNAFSKL